MLYPTQCCDGVLHSLAGPQLQLLLRSAPVTHSHTAPAYTWGEDLTAQELCPIGSAVVTPTGGTALARTGYSAVAHTPPPLYPALREPGEGGQLREEWRECLASCYTTAIAALVAWHTGEGPGAGGLCIATPLLGCGARGAPVVEGAEAAVQGLLGLVQAPGPGLPCRTTVGLFTRDEKEAGIVAGVFSSTLGPTVV